MSKKTRVSFFDTKPYDREFFDKAELNDSIEWEFHDFGLKTKTAIAAQGEEAVCAFVNDHLDRPCLQILKEVGIKLIALRCAGYNNIDLNAAKEFNIAVTRVPAYSPYSVAEHTVALFLSLNRKIHRAHDRVKDHNFSLNGLMGFDTHNKTIGIIGTGKIGQITAQIFKGFGTKVLAFDIAPSNDWAKKHDIEYTSLNNLLETSDVISLHVPLFPDMVHMIDAKAIARMKKGACIINTSRGKLIDTKALVDAIKSGQLGGVALDVYEEEEGIFFEDLSNSILKNDELSLLLNFPNVLITAHQAFFTKEAVTEIARVTTENILRFQQGKPFLEGTSL